MKDNDKFAKLFWESMEDKFGEPITGNSLLHVMQSDYPELRNNCWCLGMLTDSRFILQANEPKSWITALMQQNRFEEKPLELEIPRENIRITKKDKPSGFFARLLNSYSYYTLEWTEEGETYAITFELDKKEEDFIALLI